MAAPESMSTVRADSAAAAPRPLPWPSPYLFVSSAGQRPYLVYTPTRVITGAFAATHLAPVVAVDP